MKKVIIALIIIAAAVGIGYKAMNPTPYKHPMQRSG